MKNFFLGLMVLGFIVGCGGSAGVCPTQKMTDPKALLLQYNGPRQAVKRLQAEARVEQRGGSQGRIKGTLYMFVERPGNVRVDAMTQFGPAKIFTTNHEVLALTDLKENRFFSGPSCPSNLGRLLGIAMPAEVLVDALLGGVPNGNWQSQSMMCSANQGYSLSQRHSSGLTQESVFVVPKADKDKPQPSQRLELSQVVLKHPDGHALWRMTFSDFTSTPHAHGSIAFPFKVSFEDLETDTQMMIRFKSIKLDPVIPDGAFIQAPRSGLEAEVLMCE